LLFFTNPWIVSKVVSAWEIPSMDSRIIIQPFDVGIVMGGSMRYYDPGVGRVVYSSSVDRLIQAMQLYHDGKIKKIMLTGGSGFVNFQDWKESGLIAKFLLSSGIPESDIILENNSRNTYENAALSADILKRQPSSKRQLLITSGFHMRRSLLCFKKAGLDPVPFSVDIRSASHINTLDRLIQPDAECLVQVSNHLRVEDSRFDALASDTTPMDAIAWDPHSERPKRMGERSGESKTLIDYSNEMYRQTLQKQQQQGATSVTLKLPDLGELSLGQWMQWMIIATLLELELAQDI